MQDLLPREKYREVLDITPVCCVDVMFFNSDKTKTLLFKRQNEPVKGIYYSAGGRLLKNERIEDCAVRQGLREVGININRNKLTFGGVQEELHPNSVFEGVSYHAIVIYYGYVLNDDLPATAYRSKEAGGRWQAGEIKLDSQHSDYQWFSVSDESLHPFIKSRIANLLKMYGQKL